MLFRVTYNKAGFLNKRKHNMAAHSLLLQIFAIMISSSLPFSTSPLSLIPFPEETEKSGVMMT